MTSNKKTWIWIGFLLLVLLAAGIATTSNAPKEYPPYTLESPSPTGLKAFYTYAKDAFGHVSVLDSRPETTDKSTKGDQLLIMTEPAIPGDSDVLDDYKSYVASGQTILLLKENPDGMLGINTQGTEPESAKTLQDQAGQEYATSVPGMHLKAQDKDKVLLEDDTGPVALKRPIGDGTLIAVTAPAWLTNDKILDADHLQLIEHLMNEAGGGLDHVVFATGHRAGTITSFLNVFPNWLLVLTGFMILLTMLWLWHQSKRFGRVEIPREATVRFSEERIHALAAWYQRAERYRDAVLIQADYLKFLLQEKWGISYRRTWRESAQQLATKLDDSDEGAVTQFATGLEDILQKQSLSKAEFLQWTKKIDKIKKEVETR